MLSLLSHINTITYSPSCMGFSRTLIYLKSGRWSGSSLQQSWIQRMIHSGHLSWFISGRNGQAPAGQHFTRSTISVEQTTKVNAIIADNFAQNRSFEYLTTCYTCYTLVLLVLHSCYTLMHFRSFNYCIIRLYVPIACATFWLCVCLRSPCPYTMRRCELYSSVSAANIL